MRTNYFYFLFFLLLGVSLHAEEKRLTNTSPPYDCDENSQYLYWTGEENSDFFNENNWRINNQIPSKDEEGGLPYCLPGANKEDYQICLGKQDPVNDRHPETGSVDPGSKIKYNLYAEGATIEANGAILFNCDGKGLTLSGSKIHIQNWENGVLSLNNHSTAYLEREQNFGYSKYNLLDAESWIYFYKNNPVALNNSRDSFMVDDTTASLNENIKFDQYYQEGSIIRQLNDSYTPLEIYSGNNLSGASSLIKADKIYSGSSIPESLDNSISSFKLKRGYQVTFAIQENGTSMSKVYIASEEDLEIDDLPAALQNTISFIRVVRWEWIVKKGTGGYINDLNAGWYYNWNNNQVTEANYQYVPMAWGASGASSSAVKKVTGKDDVNHLLGFNESDNCNDQSGQYNNLCEPSVAVAYYENLMGTGLRLGTPAPRENGPFGWLDEFNKIAQQRNVRFDFVAVHWYDWGSNPANTPNASASVIFNRFKDYLGKVHNKYNLPIWITEFNANPNRGNATQEAFLKLALPYLESLDYVERYAYFQPNGGAANYKDTSGNLTNIGELYLNHQSTPSIPELTYSAPNNLDGLDMPYEEKDPIVMSFEAECSQYLGNQLVPEEDENASNNYYLQLDTSREGATSLARQVQFDINVPTTSTYRLWIRYKSSTGTNASVKIDVDESGEYESINGLKNSDFDWEQLPRFFELSTGNHRITIEIPNNLFLFDALALISDSGSVDLIPQEANTCTPPENRWGATETDITYFKEAEEANPLGIDWKIDSSPTAINGAYVQTDKNATDMPPEASGYANFNFDIAESDRYEIWGKIQALNEDSDAFWVKVDDGNFKKWDNLKSEIYRWYWKKFHSTVSGEDRELSYFLEAGTHQVIIAYNEANTKIDRLAVSSFGKSPADEDPNVIFPDANLEFEAEDAILVGGTSIVNCAQSSHGQQVKINKGPANLIRFEGIGVALAGTYNLKVSYMSANSRYFGLVVNGDKYSRQLVPSSGSWCYAGGVPGVYEVNVDLKAGENTIEITGTYDDVPFIDKIEITKDLYYEMEAEDAELLGNSVIQNCDAASKGQYVNMNPSSHGENAISFKDINIQNAGAYTLKIDYMTAGNRPALLQVNDGYVQNIDFQSSGEWCYNGGTPITREVTVDLNSGSNSILIKKSGDLAPLIDRISIVANDQSEIATATLSADPVSEESDMVIFPNPVDSGAKFTVAVPSSMPKVVILTIYDMSGNIRYQQEYLDRQNDMISLQPSLNTGTYIVYLTDGNNSYSKLLSLK